MPVWDPLGPDRFLRELQGLSRREAAVACWQREHNAFASVLSGPDTCLQLQRCADGGVQLLKPPAMAAMALSRRQPLLQLLAMAEALGLPAQGQTLGLQLHDEQPRHARLLHFDAAFARSAPSFGGVPDPYCLASRGFLLLRQAWRHTPLPPWSQRHDRVIWRGSSTGLPALDRHRLLQLPRYRLCRRLQQLEGCDARFTAVVQAASSQADHDLRQELQADGLLTERLAPEQLAAHRWLLDIDGNVNSWGLLWKLLSGSCVLRVQSARGQWFHHRLRAYEHLVPIRADLSDLEVCIDWCRSHPRACAAIAAAGQRLAIQVLEELGADLLTALRWAAAAPAA
ncbi:glycosyl transferase 90 family protein [Synechococcus sp. PROS-7-1]|uniref:glycosyl transferase family 90 n=1 Tax=Synechococcus sp. PROS-7-1 TaxID=1442556 RepID=UPI001647582B|nr:glycosyl transferase family 90 [Synechococcus sp. PROS-7-1]QNI83985.1 glycosyl transferase 90 family protein [Synechococcus sp. PROS-7-1]